MLRRHLWRSVGRTAVLCAHLQSSTSLVYKYPQLLPVPLTFSLGLHRTSSWPRDSSVHLWPKRPMVSWAAISRALPAGWGNYPSILLCTSEATFGVLGPVLCSPEPERPGDAGALSKNIRFPPGAYKSFTSFQELPNVYLVRKDYIAI